MQIDTGIHADNSNGATWFGIYLAVGINIASRLLEYAMPLRFAAPVGHILLVVIGYPIFIRGFPNIWTKDKRPWKFLPFLGVNLVVALLEFFVFLLFHRITGRF